MKLAYSSTTPDVTSYFHTEENNNKTIKSAEFYIVTASEMTTNVDQTAMIQTDVQKRGGL